MKKSMTSFLGLGLLWALSVGCRAENFIPEIQTVALSPQGHTLLVAATTSHSATRAVFWREGQVYWQWDFPSARGHFVPRPNPFWSEDSVGFIETGPGSQISCSSGSLPEKQVRSWGRGTELTLSVGDAITAHLSPFLDAVAGRLWVQDIPGRRRSGGLGAHLLNWSATAPPVEIILPGIWSLEGAVNDSLYLAMLIWDPSLKSEEKGLGVYRFRWVPAPAGGRLEQSRRVSQKGLPDVLVWSPRGKYVGLCRNAHELGNQPRSESFECYSLDTEPWRLVFQLEGSFTSWAFDEPRDSAVMGVSRPEGRIQHYVVDLAKGTLSPIFRAEGVAVVYGWRAEAAEMVAVKPRKDGRFWFRSEKDLFGKRGDLVKVQLRRRNEGYEPIQEEEIPWEVVPARSEGGEGGGAVSSVSSQAEAEAQRHYAAGLALKRAGKYTEAVSAWQKALEFQGDYADAHAALAWAYVAQKRKDAAIVEFHAAAWFAGEGERGQEARAALQRLGGTITTPHIALVEGVLSTPEDRLRLTPTILQLCRLHDPRTNVEKCERQLDEMAAELKRRIGEQTAPPALLQTMREYLFGELQYQPVPLEQVRLEHWLPAATLASRKGSGQSLSLLTLCLGEKLGLPLYGVEVPGYFFVRYDDGTTRINVETAVPGASPTDEDYRRLYRVPSDEAASRVYLVNLSKREALAAFLFTLGYWLQARGKVQEAIVVDQQALRLRPSDYRLYAGLGWALYQQGDLEAAKAAYQQALRLQPQDPEIHVGLGDVLKALFPFCPMEAAAREYRAALEIDPENAGAHRGRGDLWQILGKYEEAIQEYRAALRSRPQDYRLRLALAFSLKQQGKAKEADQEFQAALQAIRLTPSKAQVHFDLAVAYQTMGRYQEAMKEYETLKGLDQDLAALLLKRYLSPPPPPPAPGGGRGSGD